MKFLMRSGKIAGWVIGVLLGCCISTIVSSAPSISYSLATLSFSPAGPYSPPRDEAVGSVLATSNEVYIAAQNFDIALLCNLDETATITGSGSSGIWATGVTGIGVSFYFVQPGQEPIIGSNTTLITSSGQSKTINIPLHLGGAPVNLYGIVARLFVTGQISPGGPLNLPTIQISLTRSLLCPIFSNGTQTLSTVFSSPVVTPITCTVATPSVSVTLPNISTTSLSSVGQTVGNTPFTIGLNCSSGANVYVTLTDAATPSNTTSLLSLGPSSTAAGVKLRILKSDSNPVFFGPDSAVAGTTNQWLVGSSASTNDIPLTVQYYRNGALTAGTVNAAATFTMSYQ